MCSGFCRTTEQWRMVYKAIEHRVQAWWAGAVLSLGKHQSVTVGAWWWVRLGAEGFGGPVAAPVPVPVRTPVLTPVPVPVRAPVLTPMPAPALDGAQYQLNQPR